MLPRDLLLWSNFTVGGYRPNPERIRSRLIDAEISIGIDVINVIQVTRIITNYKKESNYQLPTIRPALFS